MKRLVSMAALVVLALAPGCRRSEPKQVVPAPEPMMDVVAATPTPTPVPCKAVKDLTTEIKVYPDGTVDPACIEIWGENKTTVEWVAQKPAVGVEIAWKPNCPGQSSPSLFPARPTSSGDKCVLAPSAYSNVLKKTEYCYSVTVTSPNKPPVTVDPVLIINP